MRLNPMRFDIPIVQAAIAGKAEFQFCQKLLDLEIGMVTLGGYSIDLPNYQASKKMRENGRMEFLYPINLKKLEIWGDKNLKLEKKSDNQFVAINMRICQIDKMSLFWLRNLIKNVDIIELNAHCRQPEVIAKKSGEYLLTNLEKLEKILLELREIVNDFPIGIKVRGYRISDLNEFIRISESSRLTYIHVDAMIPGKSEANLDMLKKIVHATKIPVIGNNSVRNVENVKEMLNQGAIAASLARPLIDNPRFIQKLIDHL